MLSEYVTLDVELAFAKSHVLPLVLVSVDDPDAEVTALLHQWLGWH